jgi:hypothetical protein
MDATGAGFQLPSATSIMPAPRAELGIGGPPYLLGHLTQLIADLWVPKPRLLAPSASSCNQAAQSPTASQSIGRQALDLPMLAVYLPAVPL